MGGGSSKSRQQPEPGQLLATPKFKGTKKTPLFNGLLYRIEDENTNEWAFFNNSRDYEFHVKYLLALSSTIEALGDTTVDVQDDGIYCEMRLLPLETKMFVQGDIHGYESKLEAMPLSEEYFAAHPELDEAKYFQRLDAPQATEF